MRKILDGGGQEAFLIMEILGDGGDIDGTMDTAPQLILSLSLMVWIQIQFQKD